MALTKVLITVKTYPTLSSKYDELVCTAGFREDGTWIRIYPIAFRKLDYVSQYRKYDWVEVDLVKNDSDFRPESFRPRTEDTEVRVVGHVDTTDNWRARKEIALKNVHTNLEALWQLAKDRQVCTSLAVFKPTKVKDFIIEPVEREWNREKLERLRQGNLFEQRSGKFEVVRKLPYKFSYQLEDDDGRESTMMIEDWEIGALYWNMVAKHEGNEDDACKAVKAKYLDDFACTKDLHLYLGTTRQHHLVAKNPFVIIGTLHPKPVLQRSLF